MHKASPSLTPYKDDWAANTTTESTAHTMPSAANLNAVFGNDVSPIPHGLPDVSGCAHSEPKSQPKAGEGASNDEVLMDDDEESSRGHHMPFDKDLCDLSDHDSDVEPPSCKGWGARVEPEVRSGPSREAKRARVDDTIKDAQRSLSKESIAKFLAHECDCGKDCCSFITRKDFSRWRAATFDFVQHGRVADHALNLLDAVDVAISCKPKYSKRPEEQF